MLRQVYFCIGAAKTGTTILTRLLDQQPDVASLWEGYFLRPSKGQSLFNPDGNAWRRHGFEQARVVEWHERATRRVSSGTRTAVAIREPSHVRQLITEVFEDFGRRMSATIVGDKWPDYHKHLDLMLEAFPEGRFVYNVRDPRAVWNSGETFRGRQVGDETLANMLAVDQVVAPYLDDDRFLTIRYEELIGDPSSTMRHLSEFLGFVFDPGALVYDAEHDPLPNRWYWIPEASGDLDVELTSKWRAEMPTAKQSEVAALSTEFMERYGYVE